MGGGTSRLDVTDWEAADGGCRPDSVNAAYGDVKEKISGGDGDGVAPSSTPSKVKLNTYTIDGAPPTRKYGLYELQKTSVGQRAFDVVDDNGNVLYITKPVPKTLAWFDVCGPASMGDFVDCRLRVQALDHFRRTWIVYRYHEPFFEGQRPANPAQFEGKIPENVKLYKMACITVSWSRYVAVSARYGPPDPEDFVEDETDSKLSDDTDDPLFAVPSQIAARSREKQQTEEKDLVLGGDENDELAKDEKSDKPVESTADQTTTSDSTTDSQNDASDDVQTTITPPSDPTSLSNSADTSDTIIPLPSTSSTSVTTKRRSSKLPATTLTQLAASHSSTSRASSAMRRTSVKTQQLRRYFGSNKNITDSGPSSRFGSRFFSKIAVSEDNYQDDKQTDEAKGESTDYEVATAISVATGSAGSEAEPQQSLQELYKEALEGVIDLDNQPIVQCQEIYNKMLGNHQTMILTKEELFALLKLDEAQHEEQLQQRVAQAESSGIDDDCRSPIEQAVELEVKHHPHQNDQKQESRASRLMSRFSSFRSRNAKANGADNSATPDSIEKQAANIDSDDKDHNNANGGSVRSSWNRFFSGKSNEANDASCDLITSMEQTQQSTEIENATAALSARETMPSLMDDTTSNNSSAQDLDAVEQDGNDEEGKARSTVCSISDKDEGSGGPPGDVNDTEPVEEYEATTHASLTTIGKPQKSATDDGIPQNPPVDDHPNPLVSYWFWKHTTFNFQQHKMHMHLAKNSDLALHVILAIIVNQVRSERNHTVFATTGLHPAWFFIDPRNPKAMFQ